MSPFIISNVLHDHDPVQFGLKSYAIMSWLSVLCTRLHRNVMRFRILSLCGYMLVQISWVVVQCFQQCYNVRVCRGSVLTYLKYAYAVVRRSAVAQCFSYVIIHAYAVVQFFSFKICLCRCAALCRGSVRQICYYNIRLCRGSVLTYIKYAYAVAQHCAVVQCSSYVIISAYAMVQF